MAAQGFFAAQGFLAAQGFAAQGFAAFFLVPLCFFFMSQGFFAAQGLAFIAHGLPFMAQGLSAAYTEALIIKATAPNIAKILFIFNSPFNVYQIGRLPSPTPSAESAQPIAHSYPMLMPHCTRISLYRTRIFHRATGVLGLLGCITGLVSILHFCGIGGQGGQLARIPRERLGCHRCQHAKLHHLIEMHFAFGSCALFHHAYLVRIRFGEICTEGIVALMTGIAGHAVAAQFGVIPQYLAFFDQIVMLAIGKARS
ncbi:MAG: hypothetical protein KGL01_04175 [Betaproteobacteria bacterium]|nr:hypothetical protein [Betaproteobacteria bacterium]